MDAVGKIKALINAYVELAQESDYSYAQIVDSLTDIFDENELKELGYSDFILAASVERSLVKKTDKSYPLELYYGYKETRNGIQHAFELVGMDGQPRVDEICQCLAASLDTTVEDTAFHWDSTQVGVPLAVIQDIRKAAVKGHRVAAHDGRKAEMNTKICYTYCDASNYKVRNECVIRGEMSEKMKQRILGCRSDGEFFIPSAVGLPEKRFSEWDEQDDHPWFKLFDDSFSSTYEQATVDMTCKELVAAFDNCKDNWERLALAAMDRICPMSVAELIGQATDRSNEKNHGAGPDKDIDLNF